MFLQRSANSKGSSFIGLMMALPEYRQNVLKNCSSMTSYTCLVCGRTQIFTQVLKAFLGPENVLEVHQLLFEALAADAEKREDVIRRVIDYEELPANYADMLMGLDNRELTKVLITGYWEAEDYYLFDPVPNFIFTRILQLRSMTT